MSQPAICNKCKDAGFANELIKFQQDGTKPDGSKKWKILNASDGSEHKHKTKEKPQELDGMKDLAAAIRELAAAIRSRPA